MSYEEIGQIMLCTMPFTYKVFWAPFVDLYYIPSLGKRKSWVIPCQMIGSMVLFYLSANVEELLMTKQLGTITGILLFMVFIITC